ncbi:hypothetical protein HMI54_013802 [Coelomomyces lativittatus]|nr:hypothetical protein HMI55_001882 [Coelomomyces lativittatus]KAJ1513996.1 hypothetical protein HMI56_001374 [Coelomomyces lativittatus]KAJ1514638.1 hypothetical protein HMI54_013802 [Coelomomyces lativittatus]
MRTLRIYCFPFFHSSTSSPSPHSTSTPTTFIYASEPSPFPTLLKSPSFSEKLLYIWPQRALLHWNTWQNAESSLKRKVYGLGTRLFEQLPWQETLVKTWHAPQQVELKCHPMYTSVVSSQFSAFLISRKRHHQVYRALCLIALPFSALLSIVPGPNLPLFYNLFRIHAHHIASTHLKTFPLSVTVHEHPSLPKTFPDKFDRAWLHDLKATTGLSKTIVDQIGSAWLQELKKKKKR